MPLTEDTQREVDQGSDLELWLDHPVLAAGGGDLVSLLRQRYAVEQVAAGETIAVTDQRVEVVCFLLDGAVRACQRAEDGRELLSRLHEAPAVVGDAEALRGIPHLWRVETLERCLVVRIPAADFRQLLEKVPAMMQAELVHMASLACVGSRNELAVLGSLEQRIANVLLAYARRYGRQIDGGRIEIRHTLSLKMLARSVGGVWRSVGHVLSGLRKKGVVGKRDDLIVIEHLDDLELLAAPILGGLNYQIGMAHPRRTKRKRTSAEVAISSGNDLYGGQQIQVDDEIVIGCEPPVDLLVSDPAVCPRHARVFRSPTGNRYWIQDLQSHTGTRINGENVRRALLRDGDRISVGGTELVFRLTAEDAGQAAVQPSPV